MSDYLTSYVLATILHVRFVRTPLLVESQSHGMEAPPSASSFWNEFLDLGALNNHTLPTVHETVHLELGGPFTPETTLRACGECFNQILRTTMC